MLWIMVNGAKGLEMVIP